MFTLLGFIPGWPGLGEMLIIAAIVLLLFGNRLPGAMRSLGRSVVEFKKGIRDDTQDDGTQDDGTQDDGQNSDKVEDKSKQEEAAK